MAKKFQSIIIQMVPRFFWICLDCGNKNYVENKELEDVRCDECTQKFWVTEECGKSKDDDGLFDDEDEEKVESDED